MTLNVRYHNTSNGIAALKEVTAYDMGGNRVSFMLGNNQDILDSNDSSLKGWIVDNIQYEYNEICTTTYTWEWTGYGFDRTRIRVVEVYPWQDINEVYAQFFVYKRGQEGTSASGVTGDYYSVGTGKLTQKFSGTGTVAGGDNNTGGSVAEYIKEAPSAYRLQIF